MLNEELLGRTVLQQHLSPLLPEVAACNGRGRILHLASKIWDTAISLKCICISYVEISTADT